MDLLVILPDRRIALDVPEESTLAAALERRGILLDLRCGGLGRCGNCTVELVSGTFRSRGKTLTGGPGVKALSCITRPAGKSGVIAIPKQTLLPEADTEHETGSAGVVIPPGTDAAVFDLGTTTVVCLLIRNGTIQGRSRVLNRQSVLGDNVLDRIRAAAAPEGLRRAQNLLVESMMEAFNAIPDPSSAPVPVVAVAANTVVTYLLHGADPAPLGCAPFALPRKEFPDCPAGSVGLTGKLQDAVLRTAPLASAFLGGDAVAGAAALALARSGEPELLVDLGTNCEMILAAKGKFFGTSAAAGPAFERRFSRAGRNVITRLAMSQGGAFRREPQSCRAPEGICGSALLDWLRLGRERGFLLENGALVPERLKALGCLAQDRSGRPACAVAPGILLSGEDVEALLKAKAAIRSALDLLCEEAGVSFAQLRRIHLAGAFAGGLDPAAAEAVGLFPHAAPETFLSAGNTALAGALRLAVTEEFAEKCSAVAQHLLPLDLTARPDFGERFLKEMRLPR